MKGFAKQISADFSPIQAAAFLFVLGEPIRLPKPRFNLAGSDMSSSRFADFLRDLRV
jgi:hypothetical protein